MKEKINQLELDSKNLVGEGSKRQCYQHPNQPRLCVKITTNHTGKRRDQNLREFNYYKFLERKGISWERIAKCYGWVQTNLGKGLVFDLVCDKNNQTLPNLEEQLKANNLNHDELRCEIQELKDWTIQSAIIVADLRAANIIYDPNRPKGKRLILVDGVSNRNYIKLANYIPYIARNKMNRIWARFYKNQLQPYGISIE